MFPPSPNEDNRNDLAERERRLLIEEIAFACRLASLNREDLKLREAELNLTLRVDTLESMQHDLLGRLEKLNNLEERQRGLVTELDHRRALFDSKLVVNWQAKQLPWNQEISGGWKLAVAFAVRCAKRAEPLYAVRSRGGPAPDQGLLFQAIDLASQIATQGQQLFLSAGVDEDESPDPNSYVSRLDATKANLASKCSTADYELRFAFESVIAAVTAAREAYRLFEQNGHSLPNSDENHETGNTRLTKRRRVRMGSETLAAEILDTTPLLWSHAGYAAISACEALRPLLDATSEVEKDFLEISGRLSKRDRIYAVPQSLFGLLWPNGQPNWNAWQLKAEAEAYRLARLKTPEGQKEARARHEMKGELRRGIATAFKDYNELGILFTETTGQNFGSVVSPVLTLDVCAFELIEWFEARQSLDKLLQAIMEVRQQNQNLIKVCTELRDIGS